MVLIGSLLACVSSVPFDAGYGVPAAPLIVSSPVHTVSQPLFHSIPAPAAPLPLQLLHSGPVLQQGPVPFPLGSPNPLVHSVPHPVLHSVPAPIQVAGAPFGFDPAFAPAPLPFGVDPAFAPAPLPFGVDPRFAPAPIPFGVDPRFAPAPLPLGVDPAFAPAPLPFGVDPRFAPAPLPFGVDPAFAPAPLPFAAAPGPLRFAAAPAPAPLPIPSTPSSQFHAQDEFGQFSFGYENINSAKTETRDAFGVTRGSYQYVDANGILQTVNYIADPVNGFRVAGTNIPVAPAAQNVALPVAPKAPVVEPLVAPVPVMETPEVAAARAEHLAAHEEAKAAVATAIENKTEPTTEAEL